MKKLDSPKHKGIVIIGNGFDLNLGLKTSYSSFLRSNHFNRLVKLKHKLAIYLINIQSLKNWIDVEKELKNYSNNKTKKIDFLSEFKELSKALSKFLEDLKLSDINTESAGYKLIQQIYETEHKTLFIDFNYTGTLKYILEKLRSEKDNQNNIEHVKIHGSIEKGDIIFGVEDDAEINQNHIFLKKSVNKNFNPLDFSKSISICNHLILFGYSLGDTDSMYFEDYFKESVKKENNQKKQQILIYHHGEQSYFDIFSQIDKLTEKKVTKFKQLNSVNIYDI